jgi:hypothetical protein
MNWLFYHKDRNIWELFSQAHSCTLGQIRITLCVYGRNTYFNFIVYVNGTVGYLEIPNGILCIQCLLLPEEYYFSQPIRMDKLEQRVGQNYYLAKTGLLR